jgi:hypothetical protein
MAFPMNFQQNGVTRRYLDWLLSRQATTPAPPSTPSQQPQPTTSFIPQDLTAGMDNAYNIGSVGSFSSPVSGQMSDYVRRAMVERGLGGLRTPVDFSQQSPEDISRYMQQTLAVGQYPLNNYNREYLSGLNTVLDKIQKYAVDPATGQLISRYRLMWEDALAQDPSDQMAQKVVAAMEDVRNGVDPQDIFDKNPDFNETIKNSINQYAKDNTDLQDLNFDLVSFASNEGLPLPTEQWNIDPDAMAKLVFAKTSGPDAGKTEFQIASELLKQAQADYGATQKNYIPKDRAQIEAMLQVANTKTDLANEPILRGQLERKAAGAASQAARSAASGGAGADAAERAATSATERVMTAPLKYGTTNTTGKQKAMQQKIEEQVWNEGYKAMRGLKTGGDVRLEAEASRRKQEALFAQQRQDAYAQAVAEELTRRFGTPLESALKQARAVINANSKELDRVPDMLSQYPFNVR